MKFHLAIFRQPFLDLVLDGRKTVESRFSRVRGLPFGMVSEGDRVFCKESGGMILGEFSVGKVLTYSSLDRLLLKEIEGKFDEQMCANVEPFFWRNRSSARYATLVFVDTPVRYETPASIRKTDRRSWVILEKEPFTRT